MSPSVAATVTDDEWGLSAGGGRRSADGGSASFAFSRPGSTASGRIDVTGLRPDEEAFLAGVQFVDLVAGQSEPLRALMDAPF